jgi:hypothetical protein
MTPIRLSALFVLAASAAAAQAQVYRCGDNATYTDKPCEGAEPVDLRTNLLNAGPRTAPPPPAEAPVPVTILPVPARPAAAPSEGDVWTRKDARDGAINSRTNGNVR